MGHIRSLIALSSFIVTCSAYAKMATLEIYLTNRLKNNNMLKVSGYEFQKGLHTYQSYKNKFDISLGLNPSYEQSDNSISPGDDYNSQSYGATGNITGTLKTATQITIGAGLSKSQKDELDYSGQNNSFSFKIEQPLLKNSFGRENFLLEDYYKSNADILKHQNQEENIAQCNDGIMEYLDTYISQVTLKLYLETMTRAEKVWKITEANYNRKLISKLNYLAARSDYQALKEKISAINLSHIANQTKLKKYIDENELTLSNPVEALTSISILNEQSFKQSALYKQEKNKVDAKEKYYQYIKDTTHPELNAYVKIENTETNDVYNSSVTESDSKYIVAGVTFNLPIANTSYKASIKNAFIDKEISRHNLNEAMLDFNGQKAILNAQIKHFQETIKLKNASIKILEEQSDEAYRLLQKTKIDFKDYVIYRDRFIYEQINILATNQKLVEAKLALHKLYSTTPNICMDL